MIPKIHTIEDDGEYYAAVFADIFKSWRDAKKSGLTDHEIAGAIDDHVASRHRELWQAYQAETDEGVQFYIDWLLIRYEYHSCIAVKKLAGDDRSEEEIGQEFNDLKQLSFAAMTRQNHN